MLGDYRTDTAGLTMLINDSNSRTRSETYDFPRPSLAPSYWEKVLRYIEALEIDDDCSHIVDCLEPNGYHHTLYAIIHNDTKVRSYWILNLRFRCSVRHAAQQGLLLTRDPIWIECDLELWNRVVEPWDMPF